MSTFPRTFKRLLQIEDSLEVSFTKNFLKSSLERGSSKRCFCKVSFPRKPSKKKFYIEGILLLDEEESLQKSPSNGFSYEKILFYRNNFFKRYSV